MLYSINALYLARNLTDEAYFVFENGNTFAFEKLNISINAIQCPLLYAKGGTITLTQDVFVGVRVSLSLSLPVLSLTSCDVYISNVNVTNLALNDQGVIYLENVTGYIYNTRFIGTSNGVSSPIQINITSASNSLYLGTAPTESSSVYPSLTFVDTTATVSSIRLIWEGHCPPETTIFPVEFGEVVFDRPDEYDHDQISVTGECGCNLIETEGSNAIPSLNYVLSKCNLESSSDYSTDSSWHSYSYSDSASESNQQTEGKTSKDSWRSLVIVIVIVAVVVIVIVIAIICLARENNKDDDEEEDNEAASLLDYVPDDDDEEEEEEEQEERHAEDEGGEGEGEGGEENGEEGNEEDGGGEQNGEENEEHHDAEQNEDHHEAEQNTDEHPEDEQTEEPHIPPT